VAADPGWTDITTEVVGVLGDASRGTTYCLKNNSIRSVKSVNLTGVTYRQAVFSFLERGSTYRLTYSFNCPEYSFKLGSHAPGYWHDLQWILPEHDKNSFSWFAFKYLCGARPDPWVLVTEDVDGARFFLNKKAAYKLSFPRHGPVYTFVAVIIEPKETAAPSEKSDQSLKWPD
jgi:hypothetical protein